MWKRTQRQQQGEAAEDRLGSAKEEGATTKEIEDVTSRAPSLTYLTVAGAAGAAALGLFATGKRQ